MIEVTDELRRKYNRDAAQNAIQSVFDGRRRPATEAEIAVLEDMERHQEQLVRAMSDEQKLQILNRIFG